MMKKSKLASVTFLGALCAVACAGGIDGSDPSGADFAAEAAESSRPVEGDAAEPSAVELRASSAAVTDEQDEQDESLDLGTVQQALGGSCGSRSDAINSVFNATTVPDHFPPDSIVAQLAAVAIGVPLGGLVACVPFGIANMGPTCDAHDACYATPGKRKSDCDSAARSGWERACKNTYGSIGAGDVALGILTGGLTASISLAEQGCREACLGMANAMFAAISGAGQSAFDAAQRDASRPRIDHSNGPIFF
jgi:hypothetical protein